MGLMSQTKQTSAQPQANPENKKKRITPYNVGPTLHMSHECLVFAGNVTQRIPAGTSLQTNTFTQRKQDVETKPI